MCGCVCVWVGGLHARVCVCVCVCVRALMSNYMYYASCERSESINIHSDQSTERVKYT